MLTGPHDRPPLPPDMDPRRALAELAGAVVLLALVVLYAMTDVHAVDRLLLQLLAWL